ncbi:MAG: sulfite exporter TauE/SafE family protein, partial [Candidatus Thiodiazotropha sp. (ex Lucinoma borealis)]|nr:sulfite exporter TauE/SafE family protein [Candidatus Thiodiazotropha sp. (ex Lucinoma borealis)]
MIEQGSYVAAFVVGLLGGGHCVGMCGGIVGAL